MFVGGSILDIILNTLKSETQVLINYLSLGYFIYMSRFFDYYLSKGRERQLHQVERRTNMAYVIVHFFPGGMKAQYKASIAAVNPTRDTPPKGQTLHAADMSPGGWTIVKIDDSKESWGRFCDGTLMPRMKQGIKGGFTPPPQETTFETYNLKP